MLICPVFTFRTSAIRSIVHSRARPGAPVQGLLLCTYVVPCLMRARCTVPRPKPSSAAIARFDFSATAFAAYSAACT